ncbi:MAG: hypothetical protein R3E79_55495 [Caldilineaceae bacterium]
MKRTSLGVLITLLLLTACNQPQIQPLRVQPRGLMASVALIKLPTSITTLPVQRR